MSRNMPTCLWLALLGFAIGAPSRSGILAADPASANIDKHLAAGEFGPALVAAEKLPVADRNKALARIGAAQQNAGVSPSLATATAFSNGAGQFASDAPAAPGGGVQADFDTLMTLVQET